MFMRRLSRSLLCVGLLVTQSCTRMLTYPSPQPVVGVRIETVDDVSGRLHPLLKAMSEFCGDPPNTLLDRTRSQSTLSANEALIQHTTAGYRLDFSFHVTCDPDTTYRVAISGIKIDGREVDVPVVSFVPRSGRVPLPF